LLTRLSAGLERSHPAQMPGGRSLDLRKELRSPSSHLAIRPLIPALARDISQAAARQNQARRTLSLERACAQLKVTVEEADMTALQGLALEGRHIIVASWITSLTQRRWVLAHELGHIMVQRGRLPHCYESEEWTADWFARELLVPTLELAVLPHLTDRAAAAYFDVEIEHVILQRMRIASDTRPVIFGNQVLCPDCGHAQFLPRCGCATLRRDQARKRPTGELSAADSISSGPTSLSRPACGERTAVTL
jgi:hypothetical protein